MAKFEITEKAINTMEVSAFGPEDNMFKSFDEEKSFLDFMDVLKADTTWVRPEVRNCALYNWGFMPIGGASQIDELRSKFHLVAEDVVYEDTGSEFSDYSFRNGSKMFLAITDGSIKPYLHPLSGDAKNGAYAGWIQRIGMNAPSIPSLPLSMQQEILNEVSSELFCTANKHYATCKFVGGKIRAINGGAYAVLDQTDMVKDIIEYLNANYAGYKFVSAIYSHDRTEMTIALPEETGMVEKYVEEIVSRTGTTLFTGAVPMIRFSTADVGNACAAISTGLKIGSVEMLLGSPLKMEHKGDVDTEAFKTRVIEKMFSYYESNLKAMTELSAVNLNYPVNVFANVADKMNLTKSHVKDIMEEMAMIYGEDGGTALDVYYYLQEVVAEMTRDAKVSPSSVMAAQENLARKLVGFDWTTHDIPAVITA